MDLVQVASTDSPRAPRGLRGWSARRRMPAVVRERLMLGSSVRAIVEALSPRRLPGASPLNRVALRPYCAELLALADRLDDLDRPVSAAGMLGVRRLLTEPDSVLYARPLPDELPRDIARELFSVLDRLEVRH